MFEKFDAMNRLLDFYGGLLTPRERECLELYYQYDYSLSEIADEFTISKQAVSENIRRGERKLNNFERDLALAERFYDREKHLHQVLDLITKVYALETDAPKRQMLVEAKQILEAMVR